MLDFNILEVITFLIVYQAIVFSIYLYTLKKTKRMFTKVMTAMFVLLSCHFLFLFVDHRSGSIPLLLGPVFGLLYGPIYLMYTESLILKSIRMNKYWLHFIPAIIMLIIALNMGDRGADISIWIGWMVTAQFSIYLIASLNLIYKYRRALKKESSQFYEVSLKWLEVIIYMQFIILLVALLEAGIQNSYIGQIIIVIIYLLVLILLHCFFHLGRRQVDLFKGVRQEQLINNNATEYELQASKLQDYSSRLLAYIEQQQPYLEYGLTLTDMSEQLDISSRNLSYTINRSFGKNFYDFINSYRLDNACRLLRKTEQPIKEVMYGSGFSNKGTFNAIFKRNLGMTPSEYRLKNRS